MSTIRENLLRLSIVSLMLMPPLQLQPAVCAKPTSLSATDKTGRTDRRQLHFPVDHTLGWLTMVPVPNDFASIDSTVREQKPSKASKQNAVAAQGTVNVVVPGDQMLLLEVNKYVMAHPSSLNDVSEHGIDAIRVSFISMDEAQSTTDAVLKYAPHLRDLVLLDVGGSDVSDAGMENFRRSMKLKYIRASGCFTLHGTFLRLLATLPDLTCIDMGNTSVSRSCFRYLPQLTKLKFLAIDTKGAKREEIKEIGQCHSLVVLKFSNCRDLNDESISLLANLRNLEVLDIKSSPVSVNGVKKLSSLKLSRFELPKSYYSQKDFADLKMSFPKTKLAVIPHKDADVQDAPWSP